MTFDQAVDSLASTATTAYRLGDKVGGAPCTGIDPNNPGVPPAPCPDDGTPVVNEDFGDLQARRVGPNVWRITVPSERDLSRGWGELALTATSADGSAANYAFALTGPRLDDFTAHSRCGPAYFRTGVSGQWCPAQATTGVAYVPTPTARTKLAVTRIARAGRRYRIRLDVPAAGTLRVRVRLHGHTVSSTYRHRVQAGTKTVVVRLRRAHARSAARQGRVAVALIRHGHRPKTLSVALPR